VSRHVLVCALLFAASACASKEQFVQTGIDGGMKACEVLLADKTIPREPDAQAFCERVVNGCYEALP
jgi:hypothetical protein